MEQVEYYDNIAGEPRENNGKNAVVYRSKAGNFTSLGSNLSGRF
jgi:hypothetical protein